MVRCKGSCVGGVRTAGLRHALCVGKEEQVGGLPTGTAFVCGLASLAGDQREISWSCAKHHCYQYVC